MSREILNGRGRRLLAVVEAVLHRLHGDVSATTALTRTAGGPGSDDMRADSPDDVDSASRPSLILTIDKLRNL
jgi:hypothetical protein